MAQAKKKNRPAPSAEDQALVESLRSTPDPAPPSPPPPSSEQVAAARIAWQAAQERATRAAAALESARTINTQAHRLPAEAAAAAELRRARRDLQAASDHFHALKKKARRSAHRV